MGLLGDKMLKAGVVTKQDANRVHRQEVIAEENKRKEEKRREAREREQELEEDALQFSATKVATIQVRSCMLEALGFSLQEAEMILLRDPYHDPPLPLELIMKIGESARDIVALNQQPLTKKAFEEEKDRLLNDPEFRKTILEGLKGT